MACGCIARSRRASSGTRSCARRTTTRSPASSPRPHQPRQQPALLRDDRGNESLRRNPHPAYGCCDLGSIDLTRFVPNRSRPRPRSTRSVRRQRGGAVRMLDNVLDVTPGRSRRSAPRRWPTAHRPRLHRAGRRAADAAPALRHAAGARHDEAHRGSTCAIARTKRRSGSPGARCVPDVQRGPLPLGGNFASRLPMRSSSPSASTASATRTCSPSRRRDDQLAFATTRSNGIEPAFSWVYTRKKRMPTAP